MYKGRKMADRQCTRCKCFRTAENFNQNRKGVTLKTCNRCREKKKVSDRKCYLRNRDARILKAKEYREKNQEKLKAYFNSHYERNRGKIIQRAKQWAVDNAEKRKVYIRVYTSKRAATDPKFRLTRNLRNRLWYAVRRNIKSASTIALIGCSGEELNAYLEKQFTAGMTWENYGHWHVDHIRPCASFDMSRPEEQRICFHYSNLQPLWAKDNLEKSDTWGAKESYDNVMEELLGI
jgi:hypothetical protein